MIELLVFGTLVGSAILAINVYLFAALLIIAIIAAIMMKNNEDIIMFVIGMIVGAAAGVIHTVIKNATGGTYTLVWPHEVRLF